MEKNEKKKLVKVAAIASAATAAVCVTAMTIFMKKVPINVYTSRIYQFDSLEERKKSFPWIPDDPSLTIMDTIIGFGPRKEEIVYSLTKADLPH